MFIIRGLVMEYLIAIFFALVVIKYAPHWSRDSWIDGLEPSDDFSD